MNTCITVRVFTIICIVLMDLKRVLYCDSADYNNFICMGTRESRIKNNLWKIPYAVKYTSELGLLWQIFYFILFYLFSFCVTSVDQVEWSAKLAHPERFVKGHVNFQGRHGFTLYIGYSEHRVILQHWCLGSYRGHPSEFADFETSIEAKIVISITIWLIFQYNLAMLNQCSVVSI